MTKNPKLGFLYLAAKAALAGAQTPSSSCSNGQAVSANATGSIIVPGLEALNTYTDGKNSTWKLTTTLDAFPSTQPNSTAVDLNYFLDTSPVINVSAADLPYQGCAILLLPANVPAISHSGKNYGCDGIFSDSCYSSILNTINSNISLFLANPSVEDRSCKALAQSLGSQPSECKSAPGFWGEVVSNDRIGNPTWENTSTSSCDGGNSANVFEGTTSGADIIETTAGFSLSSNQTIYDEFVKGAIPLLITIWPKDPGSMPNFVPDTRMACLTPSNLTAGSVKPNSASFKAPGLASISGTVTVLLLALFFDL